MSGTEHMRQEPAPPQSPPPPRVGSARDDVGQLDIRCARLLGVDREREALDDLYLLAMRRLHHVDHRSVVRLVVLDPLPPARLVLGDRVRHGHAADQLVVLAHASVSGGWMDRRVQRLQVGAQAQQRQRRVDNVTALVIPAALVTGGLRLRLRLALGLAVETHGLLQRGQQLLWQP